MKENNNASAIAEQKEPKEVTFLEEKRIVLNGEVRTFKKGSKVKLETKIADKLLSKKIVEITNKEKGK